MNQNSTTAEAGASRIKLLMLWMVPIGLMAAAAIVYQLVLDGHINLGSKNEGVLIQPPFQITELALEPVEGVPAAELWAGKWTFIVRGNESCDVSCRQALYLTRQVHIRLDKDANRVQRVYLSEGFEQGGDLSSFLEKEHRLVIPVQADAEQLAQFDQQVSPGGEAHFMLVDPRGWVMMYYNDAHEGGAILKDMKHLLKYSRER